MRPERPGASEHHLHVQLQCQHSGQKLVVYLPVLKHPTANKFTSTAAIFKVIGLFESCGTLTVAKVMREVPCCDRQARDYLAFLVGKGKVQAERRGRTDEYHLVHAGTGGANELTRAVGTEFAVAAVGALEGTAFHEAALEHVTSLRRSLRDTQGPRAERLRTAFYAVRGSVPTNTSHAEHAETILDAIKLGHSIRATYQKLTDGKVKRYTLRPVAVVVHHEGLHLLARKGDGKVHTFDIEGFIQVERVKRTTPPPDFETEAYFTHAFGRYTDFPAQHVTLRLRGTAARQVRRRRFHASQAIEDDDGDALTVRFRVGVCPEFTSWLLGLAPELEVMGPPKLRDDLRTRHAEGAVAHARTTVEEP